jgi:RNA polymerase sigma-70 factor (ECF subfamily)
VAIDDERLVEDTKPARRDFDETGHWKSPPQAWNDPRPRSSSAASGRRSRCASRAARDGEPVCSSSASCWEKTRRSVCRDEGITSSNCWVILHRARIALRMCLERNWFGSETPHGR